VLRLIAIVVVLIAIGASAEADGVVAERYWDRFDTAERRDS